MRPETQYLIINQYVKTALKNETKFGGFIPKEMVADLLTEVANLLTNTNIGDTFGLSRISQTMENLEHFKQLK